MVGRLLKIRDDETIRKLKWKRRNAFGGSNKVKLQCRLFVNKLIVGVKHTKTTLNR